MNWRRIVPALRRALRISGAFIRIGYIDTLSYPLSLVMRTIGVSVPLVTFFFVAKLLGQNGPNVGGDYYTFVVIGLIAMRLLASGLQTFAQRLQDLISQGQLEMYLVEPIRWRLLPFVMIQWEVMVTFVTSTAMLLLSLAFGASYRWAGIPVAIAIVVLGLFACLAIGILDAAIKVLAKRADPILTLYTLAASVLSGTFYPLDVLPSWLRSLSWFVPHTYVLQALRSLLMPGHLVQQGPTTEQAILALVGFCVVLFPISLWFYGRSLEYGRKLGVLSGY